MKEIVTRGHAIGLHSTPTTASSRCAPRVTSCRLRARLAVLESITANAPRSSARLGHTTRSSRASRGARPVDRRMDVSALDGTGAPASTASWRGSLAASTTEQSCSCTTQRAWAPRARGAGRNPARPRAGAPRHDGHGPARAWVGIAGSSAAGARRRSGRRSGTPRRRLSSRPPPRRHRGTPRARGPSLPPRPSSSRTARTARCAIAADTGAAFLDLDRTRPPCPPRTHGDDVLVARSPSREVSAAPALMMTLSSTCVSRGDESATCVGARSPSKTRRTVLNGFCVRTSAKTSSATRSTSAGAAASGPTRPPLGRARSRADRGAHRPSAPSRASSEPGSRAALRATARLRGAGPPCPGSPRSGYRSRARAPPRGAQRWRLLAADELSSRFTERGGRLA